MNNIKKRDLALITDFYELLMMQGYFEDFEKGKKEATFDVFYRRTPFDNGFAVFCGLNEIIDYIENLKFTEGDIEYLKSLNSFNDEFLNFLKDFKWTGSLYAFHEGSAIGEREPIIKVKASLIECQLIESAMLSLFNHETLVATKAYRICEAARPYKVMEFGLRRAMSFDAGIYGAKAACIAGCVGTSNVLTAKDFDVPALGTMAHSWVMTFEDEFTAFKSFADLYPDNCILLVDTYNTLNSGVPNAIKTFEYMSYGLPIVSVNVEALAGFIEQEDIGLVVHASPSDFADGIQKILESYECYSEYCRRVSQKLLTQNLWSHRAQSVIRDLGSLEKQNG